MSAALADLRPDTVCGGDGNRRRWIASTAVVVCAYAIPLGWWLWHVPPPSREAPPPAAMVVTLSSVAMSPSESSELPPGPQQENRQASRPAPDQPVPVKKAQTAPEPAPTVPEVPEQPDPPVELARQPPEKPAPREIEPESRPESKSEPRPEPEPVQDPERDMPETAAPAAAASVASAPPQAARRAEQAAAPNRGMSRPVADLNRVPGWRDRLLQQLNAVKRYPRRARRLRQQGVSYLHFRMDEQGRVLASRIARSSGFELLDRETLALIRRAEPLPLPPAELAGKRLEFVVPVDFFLNR